ncbi:ABC transporter substrate-binding protein [Marivirga sp.]|uniref:ABC transporter substrate-binding protein n=1 Tax=Marivirga sp. TaxID=2018662 RepID=UPI003DA75A44
MKLNLKLLLFPLIIIACNPPEESKNSKSGESLISYSKILEIEKFNDYYEVHVLKPNSTDSSFFKYILYKNKKYKPQIKADAFIKIPINIAVCLSTTHLSPYTALGKSETLIGFPNTKLIYSEKLLKSATEGTLHDIGRKNGVNIEQLMALQPDFIMAYAMGSNMEQLKPLQKSGIPVLLNSDYLENSPLGRAEWLKLTAVLLDKQQAGDSLFRVIKKNYQEIKNQVAGIEPKPSVMTGLMYGDVWYVPGGESYAAKFIEDAGGHYLWSSNQKTGSLELSFESVLTVAKEADFWIGAASFSSLENLKNTNEKYALFDAYNNHNVFSYTKRVNENGANDYLETGYMRPDWILKDYVNLLHPNLLEDSSLTYFQPLKH